MTINPESDSVSNNTLTFVHSPEREKELQELCLQVLNASPERYFNPNGADETTCPFCNAKDYSNDCTADLAELKHEINCAYNIARGLLTKHKDPQSH